MKYYNVCKDEGYVISSDYYQNFDNLKSTTDYETCLDYVIQNRLISTLKEICTFIYKFKFVSSSQIKEYLKVRNIDENIIDLKVLSKLHILVQFVLEKELYEKENSKEECTIFCIGKNGVEFLKNYSNLEMQKWMIKDISRSSEKIVRNIITGDIYLNIIKNYGYENISDVSINPKGRAIGYDKLNIDMEFLLSINNIKQQFIVEVIREYDIYGSFTKRIDKLERLIGSNKSNVYYVNSHTKPKLLLVCESKKDISVVAKKLVCSSLNKNTVLYYTDDNSIKNKDLVQDNSVWMYRLQDRSLYENSLLKDETIFYEKEFNYYGV